MSGISKLIILYEREVPIMATFEVTIEKIEVFPHPNADRLELARVGLYNIVVGKGTWKTGDEVLYVPEFAILPENITIALGLEGKLSGKAQNRVKPVSLRGALSQGVVAPLSLLPDGALEKIGKDGDFAEILGITKWEPVVPASLAGMTQSAPEIVRWIEIENLKKFPDLFEDGEEVVLTEKIHGTCSCYTFVDPQGENKLLVTSKGLGKSNLALKEEEKNLYWQMSKKYDLNKLVQVVVEAYPNAHFNKIAIFGETFGAVQDLKYGYTNGGHGFVVFDINVNYNNEDGTSVSRWLNPDEVETLTEKAGIPTPPVLYKGPFSVDTVVAHASGKELVSGTESHIREGVVIRPKQRVNLETGGTKIAKYVSEEYLTRKGGTEYN